MDVGVAFAMDVGVAFAMDVAVAFGGGQKERVSPWLQ
jgi:hypothetical protein